MKFVCGVLLLISYAASLPIDKTVLPERNPCTLEALYSVKYFHPYPLDETKYIKCDPWGSMIVKMCPEGSKWDGLMMDCMFANRTMDGPILDMDDIRANETWMLNNITANKYCTLFGNHSCLNNGVCGSDLKCLCFSNTSGEYCEINKPSGGVFGKIINESFSIEEYKKSQQFSLSAMGLNDSFDYNMTLFDQSVMDTMTIEKVNKYFSMFSTGSMRFDTLVNLFVEDFLSLIFPDGFFLREFSIPTEMQMGFSNAIPRLLSVAKYSYDRFEQMFAIYEETLVRLSKFLMEKSPKIKDEAKAFYEVYHLLSDKLDKLYNYTDKMEVKPMEKGKGMVITREMVVRKLWKDFERTLNQSYELFEMLNVLDDELSWRHQIYNISLTEMEMIIQNFTASPMLVDKINRILYKNTEIWDVLSFYGFSHVLSELTSIPIFESTVVQSTFQALVADEESDDSREDDDSKDERLDSQKLSGGDDEIELREETTTRRQSRDATTVRPQALVNDKVTTLKQSREESLTTIKPQQLVGETTIRPVREELTTLRRDAKDEKLTTVKAQHLMGETTVKPQQLVGETTIKPQQLVGETTIRPVREELTTLRRDAKDEKLTTVKPQQLVGETTIRPVREETTIRPVREELTTIKRDTKEEITTILPQQLVGETTIRPVREDLTTVKPQALVSDEKLTTLKSIIKQ